MNKKGFTMVEIIVAVTIVSLIITIATIAISKMINKQKIEEANQKKNSYEYAANIYALDHKYDFSCDEEQEVNLGTLQDGGYLENIDPSSKDEVVTIIFDCTNYTFITNYESIIENENVPNNGTEFIYKEPNDYQKYSVYKSGYYLVELWGAGAKDAKGAYTKGYIDMNKGETYYIYVGKQGTNYNINCRTTGYEFNGGGIALPAKENVCGYTGGGATDIRLVKGTWDEPTSLISRIMVAGGAGGGLINDSYALGHGGELYGISPYTITGYETYLGKGATQTSGGALPTQYSGSQSNGTAGLFGKGGYGGANNINTTSAGGAGGGGGYYGGSGSSGIYNGPFYGGGGSSFISGYAGVNAIDENTTINHNDTTLHYSGKYFVGGTMQAGVNSGHGKAKITYVGPKPTRINTKLNNVRYIKDCITGNSATKYIGWLEIQAIQDGVNIAKEKTPRMESNITMTNPIFVTNGRIDDSNNTYISTSYDGTNQCIIIDLESAKDLDEIAVWHWFKDNHLYYDHIMHVSTDQHSWTPIMNETSVETTEGQRVNAYRSDNINGYVQDNLVLWYDGIQNTGTTRSAGVTIWKDLSGNGNDGTIYNGAKWELNHLYFDGINDYVLVKQTEMINNLLSNGNVTVEVGFKLEKNFNDNNVFTNTLVSVKFSRGAGWGIYLRANSDNQFQTRVLTGATGGFSNPFLSKNIDTENSFHGAVSLNYDEDTNTSTMYNYLNGGYEQADLNGGVGIKVNHYSSLPIRIGSISADINYFTNVRIYYVRIYDRALTKEELGNNYKIDKLRYGF